VTERAKHLFEFSAELIALAAQSEACYHAARVTWWRSALEEATKRVEATASVSVKRVEITGGWRPELVVDHGDIAAYHRMSEAARKIQDHLAKEERFVSDAKLYGTQGARPYSLDGEDVAHFRLNGRAREE